jgi:hypothetical protein
MANSFVYHIIIAGSPKNNYFSRNTNFGLQRVAHSLVVTREKVQVEPNQSN